LCGAGRHEEEATGAQGEGGLALDHHLDGPGEDVPDLLTGMDGEPGSTLHGTSVSTCTMSPPGMEEGRCWSSVRLSLAAKASAGCCAFA